MFVSHDEITRERKRKETFLRLRIFWLSSKTTHNSGRTFAFDPASHCCMVNFPSFYCLMQRSQCHYLPRERRKEKEKREEKTKKINQDFRLARWWCNIAFSRKMHNMDKYGFVEGIRSKSFNHHGHLEEMVQYFLRNKFWWPKFLSYENPMICKWLLEAILEVH